jgi:Tfp pilus assembly protein PilF
MRVSPKDKALVGQVRTQRGRVLLNQGNFKAARDELRRATGELGGSG